MSDQACQFDEYDSRCCTHAISKGEKEPHWAAICDIGLASLRATCEEQGRVVARVRAALYSQHRLLETNYAWAMRRIAEGMEALSPTPARRHDD